MSDHHTKPPSSPALRIKAIETLMVEKGLMSLDAVDEMIDVVENRIGPRNGAKVVARAWVDPAYRKRLLENGTAAIAELGFQGGQGEHMVVLENTMKVHNVTVCTLCSCYPWPTLGLPPVWYKSAPYRSRIVIEPRKVLGEFGLEIRRFRRGPRMGFERRDPVPRVADAAGRDRRPQRGTTRRSRDQGFDDRHRPAPAALTPIEQETGHELDSGYGRHTRVWPGRAGNG